MTAKELLAFIRLKAKHDSRMVDIKETMDLKEALKLMQGTSVRCTVGKFDGWETLPMSFALS